MRIHIINNGAVINTIVATVEEAEAAFPGAICIESDIGGIGWTYEGGILSPPEPPEKTLEEIASEMEVAVDAHIDSVARAKGYDSRITAALRAGYVNPWQAEGIVFGQWMDSCYAYCQQVQADAIAGTRTIPTIQELISELPVIVWPV